MVQKDDPPKRGRPRAYDADAALDKALDTFWKAGYSGTSLDLLSDAMDMNRPSLYGAFGDKHALYLKALDRYVALSSVGIREALSTERPMAECLRKLYELALELYLPSEGPPRGCFLIGTAATEAVGDAEVREKLADSLRRFDRAVEGRLRYAQSQGDVDASADPAGLARMAGAVMHSIAVRSRAGEPRASLKAFIESSVALICRTAAVAPRKARTAKRRSKS